LAQRAQELEQLAAAQRILAAAPTKVPKKRGRRREDEDAKSFIPLGVEVVEALTKFRQAMPIIKGKENEKHLLNAGYSNREITAVLQSRTPLAAAIRFVSAVRRMSEYSVKTYYYEYLAYLKRRTDS
jgi:hypothetical protein